MSDASRMMLAVYVLAPTSILFLVSSIVWTIPWICRQQDMEIPSFANRLTYAMSCLPGVILVGLSIPWMANNLNPAGPRLGWFLDFAPFIVFGCTMFSTCRILVELGQKLGLSSMAGIRFGLSVCALALVQTLTFAAVTFGMVYALGALAG